VSIEARAYIDRSVEYSHSVLNKLIHQSELIHHGDTEDTETATENNKNKLLSAPCYLRAFRVSVVNRIVVIRYRYRLDARASSDYRGAESAIYTRCAITGAAAATRVCRLNVDP